MLINKDSRSQGVKGAEAQRHKGIKSRTSNIEHRTSNDEQEKQGSKAQRHKEIKSRTSNFEYRISLFDVRCTIF